MLIGAGILFAIEMVADKIPYVDSVWDSVHTVVRPAVGATIGYLLGHETASLDAAIGAATGGVTALISHGIKAGLRAAVNTSPEPASNVVVSTTEDVAVTGVTALTIAHPWLAATIALVLLLLGGFLVYKVAGRIRRYKRRYDAWGERIGISVPSTSSVLQILPPVPRRWSGEQAAIHPARGPDQTSPADEAREARPELRPLEGRAAFAESREPRAPRSVTADARARRGRGTAPRRRWRHWHDASPSEGVTA